jgi:hypothetical protein
MARKQRKYLLLVQASTAISLVPPILEHEAYATLDAVDGVTEADWETKRTEISKELTLERAQQDLSDGWNAWLKENGPGKGCGTKEVIRPAGGVTSRVRAE